jgi:hypothetical protein
MQSLRLGTGLENSPDAVDLILVQSQTFIPEHKASPDVHNYHIMYTRDQDRFMNTEEDQNHIDLFTTFASGSWRTKRPMFSSRTAR